MSAADDFPQHLRQRLDAVAPAIAVDTSGVIPGARRRRRATVTGSAAAALLVVFGIAWAAVAAPWQTPEPADGGWQRPAWMDEEAPVRAEFQRELQACTDAKGWDVPVTDDGGSDQVFADPSEATRFWADEAACIQEMGIVYPEYTEEFGRQEFAWLVDVWECLDHEGIEFPPPPTDIDAWVDGYLGLSSEPMTWLPYDPHFTAFSTVRGETLSHDEIVELCPLPWGLEWPATA